MPSCPQCGSTSKSSRSKVEIEKEAAARIGLIPCPFYMARGKQMFFARESDLKTHCEVFHGES